MPVSLFHALTATTPDQSQFEIKPQAQWNAAHVGTLSVVGSEVIGAFANANGVSFGLENGSITVSVVTGLNVSAGAAAQNVSQLIFSNSNGVSFGLNGSTLTASVANAPSGLAGVVVGASTLSNGDLVFANSNGLAFGLNGSTLTGSYTTPVQTIQTQNLFAGGQTFGQSSSTTNPGTALSIVGSGVASVGFSNGSLVLNVAGGTGTGVGIAAGGSTQSTGIVAFSNANGVSFGLNNGTLTATVNPGPAAGIGAVSADYGELHSPKHRRADFQYRSIGL